MHMGKEREKTKGTQERKKDTRRGGERAWEYKRKEENRRLHVHSLYVWCVDL